MANTPPSGLFIFWRCHFRKPPPLRRRHESRKDSQSSNCSVLGKELEHLGERAQTAPIRLGLTRDPLRANGAQGTLRCCERRPSLAPHKKAINLCCSGQKDAGWKCNTCSSAVVSSVSFRSPPASKYRPAFCALFQEWLVPWVAYAYSALAETASVSAFEYAPSQQMASYLTESLRVEVGRALASNGE